MTNAKHATQVLAWCVIASLAMGSMVACQGRPAAAEEGEESEDPMAPCRRHMGGTWEVMGATLTVDPDTGSAILRYGREVHAGLIQMRDCREDGASVRAEGYDAELTFLGPDRIMGKVSGYPAATAYRVSE